MYLGTISNKGTLEHPGLLIKALAAAARLISEIALKIRTAYEQNLKPL